MKEFDVSYEIPCLVRVRAKTAREALGVAAWFPGAPFVERTKPGKVKEGIVQAVARKAHGFVATEVLASKRAEAKSWQGW